jgi:hypothetical protein
MPSRPRRGRGRMLRSGPRRRRRRGLRQGLRLGRSVGIGSRPGDLRRRRRLGLRARCRRRHRARPSSGRGAEVEQSRDPMRLRDRLPATARSSARGGALNFAVERRVRLGRWILRRPLARFARLPGIRQGRPLGGPPNDVSNQGVRIDGAVPIIQKLHGETMHLRRVASKRARSLQSGLPLGRLHHPPLGGLFLTARRNLHEPSHFSARSNGDGLLLVVA